MNCTKTAAQQALPAHFGSYKIKEPSV
uniref:Uncharacterized protein n=1 Tax=Anguilla anguilla TaxID=7936 RepID=A0A0E9XID3_ANGAN